MVKDDKHGYVENGLQGLENEQFLLCSPEIKFWARLFLFLVVPLVNQKGNLYLFAFVALRFCNILIFQLCFFLKFYFCNTIICIDLY